MSAQVRSNEEVASLWAHMPEVQRAGLHMSEDEWSSLAIWGIEPGGPYEESHRRSVEEYDRDRSMKAAISLRRKRSARAQSTKSCVTTTRKAVTMKIRPKTCQACGVEYLPAGCAQKYCTDCGPAIAAAAKRRGIDAYRRRKGVLVGIGSGHAQGAGAAHHSYRNGISAFKAFSAIARYVVRYCQRCGKDLLTAGRGQWATHHRDHDRTNNVETNFELLCKPCHQLEHECWLALPQYGDRGLAEMGFSCA